MASEAHRGSAQLIYAAIANLGRGVAQLIYITIANQGKGVTR